MTRDDTAVEKLKYKGYNISIEQDTDVENPYHDMDQLTDLVTWHRNYDFNSTRRKTSRGGKVYWEGYSPYDSPQEVLDAMANGELVYAAPLYAYEHGGITVNLGSMDYRWPDQQWDCGLLGMVYVTKEKARAEFPLLRNRTLWHACHRVAKCEVETFDQYLTGQVYGYWVWPDKKGYDKYGGESCWGFYGLEYCIEQAKEVVDSDIATQLEGHEKVLDGWLGFIPEEVFRNDATTTAV